MKITFISLFPEYYQSFLEHSIIKRAIAKNKVKINIVNPRDFATKREVDDYIYGGGPGMLMKIEPIVLALEKVKAENSYVILMGPKGRLYNQKIAKEFSLNKKDLIIIAGHYEGVDARIEKFIDEEISIGEYIMTGGEIASCVIADSIIRLLPGVINNASLQEESFDNNLIESDHYTKPENFRNINVPKVLLSGNHKEIANWRKASSLANTEKYNKEKGKE